MMRDRERTGHVQQLGGYGNDGTLLDRGNRSEILAKLHANSVDSFGPILAGFQSMATWESLSKKQQDEFRKLHEDRLFKEYFKILSLES